MLPVIVLVSNDRVQINVLHTAENVHLDLRVHLFHIRNEPLYLLTLRACVGGSAGGAGVRKSARTLDKMQVIVIPPVLDIVLTDKIQRTNKLHTLKIGAV